MSALRKPCSALRCAPVLLSLTALLTSSSGAQTLAPVITITTVTMPPGASSTFSDAFVRDGSYAAQNYGADPQLFVKNDATGFNRHAYAKFTIPALPGEIHSASVQLFGFNNAVNNGRTYSGLASLYQVFDSSWTEGTGTAASPASSGITWNNAPALSSKLSSATITNASQYYSWDATSVLHTGIGGNVAAFGIAMDNAAMDPDIFNARESGANPPKLSITSYTDGYDAASRLLLFTDGYLYGTTYGGGNGPSGGYGVIYKIDPASGNAYLVHAFSPSEGVWPYGGLTKASDGNLYGTCFSGGSGGGGVVFRLNADGSVTTIHAFSGSAGPKGALAADATSSLYGTTQTGGAGFGSVFKVTTAGAFTSLHSFNGSDGAYPWAGVTIGSDGFLYGVTRGGGAAFGNTGAQAAGSIFKCNASTGAIVWSVSPSGESGENPNSVLIPDGNGNFLGTTIGGGIYNTVQGGDGGNYGGGVIFRITPAGTMTKLKSFDNTHGQGPQGQIVLAGGDYLYGTTENGGPNPNNQEYGPGTLYRYQISTNTLTVLHDFSVMQDGEFPLGGVALSADGSTLYATTSTAGGTASAGNVFKYTLASSAFAVVHQFQPN